VVFPLWSVLATKSKYSDAGSPRLARRKVLIELTLLIRERNAFVATPTSCREVQPLPTEAIEFSKQNRPDFWRARLVSCIK
jgi:hypothetical protein